jgi:hypothetical protein
MSQLLSFRNFSSSVDISKRPFPVSHAKLGINDGAGDVANGFWAHYIWKRNTVVSILLTETEIQRNPKPHTSTGAEFGVVDGWVVGLVVLGLGVGLDVGRLVAPPMHSKSRTSLLPYELPDATFNPFKRMLYPPVPEEQQRPSSPASSMTNV